MKTKLQPPASNLGILYLRTPLFQFCFIFNHHGRPSYKQNHNIVKCGWINKFLQCCIMWSKWISKWILALKSTILWPLLKKSHKNLICVNFFPKHGSGRGPWTPYIETWTNLKISPSTGSSHTIQCNGVSSSKILAIHLL